MRRLEVGVQHFAEKRPSGPNLMLLVLHRHPVSVVVVKDRTPGVEQITNAVLDTSQPFFAFVIVLQGLFVDPGAKDFE